MNVKRGIAILGATGAIVAGALPALAQDATNDTTTQDTTREAEHAARQAEFAQSLADELGVPVEDVTAALDKIRAERQAERQAEMQARLDEAVANGELTQEQADALVAARESGLFEGRGHRGHGPRGGPGFGPRDGSNPATADGTAA